MQVQYICSLSPELQCLPFSIPVKLQRGTSYQQVRSSLFGQRIFFSSSWMTEGTFFFSSISRYFQVEYWIHSVFRCWERERSNILIWVKHIFMSSAFLYRDFKIAGDFLRQHKPCLLPILVPPYVTRDTREATSLWNT